MRKKDFNNLLIVIGIFSLLFFINKRAAAAPLPYPITPSPTPVPPANQNPLSFQMDYNDYLDH